mmetsp:Transcript_24016/g.69009  ORF Transcript_24016/g.69009 Transcript_24016/m.69009 type:complete len:203 (+) Transcript_24016:1419-2027(+)
MQRQESHEQYRSRQDWSLGRPKHGQGSEGCRTRSQCHGLAETSNPLRPRCSLPFDPGCPRASFFLRPGIVDRRHVGRVAEATACLAGTCTGPCPETTPTPRPRRHQSRTGGLLRRRLWPPSHFCRSAGTISGGTWQGSGERPICHQPHHKRGQHHCWIDPHNEFAHVYWPGKSGKRIAEEGRCRRTPHLVSHIPLEYQVQQV